jgi:CheY-like chemotaxis protein
MLDLAMPGGNGYRLASRLRAQAGLHTAKIVAVSGYNDDPASRAAGIDAHLVKPASLHQLMEFFDCEPLELAL